jgi:N-methylhydantoinase B
MLTCDITHSAEISHQVVPPFDEASFAGMRDRLGKLEHDIIGQFRAEGTDASDVTVSRLLGIRFRGQVNTIAVPVTEAMLRVGGEQLMKERFVTRYAQTYGIGAILASGDIEIEPHRVIGTRKMNALPFPLHPEGGPDAAGAVVGEHDAYFEGRGYTATTVYDGYRLRAGNIVDGPAIVQRMGDSVVVPPGFQHILAYVERVLRARLAAIPDGTWHAEGFLDHDGRTDAIYPVCCSVTKRGDGVVFDFTGTAPQATGPINCARPALEGAVLGVVMISICWDLPWAIGALRNIVEIVSEEGTINNAVGAAPVSMASVMGMLSTMDVASNAFAQLLATSERYRAEAQANWSPGINGGLMTSIGAGGHPSMGIVADPFGGGGGARTFGDGVDSGGVPHSMASRIGNVEVLESRAPVLQIYRRELPDSGGPGRFRGGVGIESAGMRHKADGVTLFQTLASGVAVPAGRGLAGGFPGGAAASTVLRGSDIAELLASGRIPTNEADLTASRTEVQQAKQITTLADDDVVIGAQAGGAGCGDPLLRDPEAVAADVRDGRVSTEVARTVYGVVVETGAVAAEATGTRRAELRGLRLGQDRAPVPLASADEARQPDGHLHRVSESIETVQISGVVGLHCRACRHRLCGSEEDYRAFSRLSVSSFSQTVPPSSGCSPDFGQYEYCCPACGTLLTVEVRRRADTPISATAPRHDDVS